MIIGLLEIGSLAYFSCCNFVSFLPLFLIDMNKPSSVMECIVQSIVQLKHKFFLGIESLRSNMLPNFIFEGKATNCYSSVYAYVTWKKQNKTTKTNKQKISYGTRNLVHIYGEYSLIDESENGMFKLFKYSS